MKWSCFGHAKQKEYLERLIVKNKLAHAYSFTGPEGVGKRMMAEDIAHYLVPAGFEPDIMRLAPLRDEETGKVKDIPIEAVRDMRSWTHLKPLAEHKVIIIDSAERLGDEAANTLLKILEEPPVYVNFFLISSAPARILPTISSRCERLDFRPLIKAETAHVLSRFKLSSDDMKLVQAITAGRPGLAIRLIEEHKLQQVASAISELQKALLGGVTERLLLAKKLSDSDTAAETISWWLSYMHYRLPQKPHLASLTADLMDLSFTVSQPQYNRRIAIEHFLLSQPVQK